jgi:hypothetical protein
MKSRHILSALQAAMTASLLIGCSKSGGDHDAADTPDKHLIRSVSTNGEAVVMLDVEAQKRIGLIVEHPHPAQWQPEVQGYGHVLDPAPLASLMSELATAQVAAETSQREFERLRTLAEQSNASVRALQAAEATAKRDQLLVESQRTKLVLGWGKAILQQNDPPAFVRSLANGERIFVRVDLPAGENLSAPPTSARLVSLSGGGQQVAGDFFDTAPAVDPQTQGQGFLFLVAGKPGGFSPNAAVTGHLKIPGPPLSGVIVPSSAVIRHGVKSWVYLQTNEDRFTRREVPLDRPVESGWFVLSAVTDKDRVITGGAQMILSQELNQSGFMGGARD